MTQQFPNTVSHRLNPRAGRPYPRPVGKGCVFRYFTQGQSEGAAGSTSCDLVLGVEQPTAEESQAFVAGVPEFVLVEVEQIPFVCVRFDQALFERGRLAHRPLIAWQECPVHPLANRGYVPSVPDETVRWRVNIVLVDISTQLTGGVRLVNLENEYCQAFARTMHAHEYDLDSIETYDAKLDGIYRRYPAGSIPSLGRLLAHSLGIDLLG